MPAPVLSIIYNSLILPHLQYSILAWGFYADRIFKLQKRAMRIITNGKYNAHIESLFKKLNWLQLRDLFMLNVVKLFYKVKPKNVSCNKSYPLWTKSNPFASGTCIRSGTGKKCIRYHMPSMINTTDPSLLELCEKLSYRGFADAMKGLWLINTQLNIPNEIVIYVGK